MIASNQRIRLAVDVSQMGNINDVLTGATPQFWNGVDLQFEIAFFYGSALLSVTNLDSVTIDLKDSSPRTGLPLMSATIDSGALNQTLTLDAWNAGAATDCHALIVFTNEETNLDLDDATQAFWLVISALTNDSPAHLLVQGATPLTVVEGGEGVEPPASVVSPTYYTAAQSDARYTLAVDLTGINTSLATLATEMTAVTATANAAMPKSGGTFTGGVTIGSISGVLKATAGLVAGSATTTDLTEGANLYWTQARFNTALAAVAGAASGICPLDSGSLIPAAFLPSITVHNTFVVSSQVAMLALAAHQGDVAVRTDLNQSFILTNNVPTVLGNWTVLLTPTSAVTSVNSLSGVVTLTTTNIAEGTNLYYTTARAKADALAAALAGFSNGTGGNVTAGDSVLVALGRLENRVALDDAKLTGSDRVKIDGSVAMTGALTFSGGTNPGVILSSLTDTQRAALTPVAGMLLYDTTTSQPMFYNGAWLSLLGGGATGNWSSGAGAPASTLGNNGSFYLDTAAGNIYLKTAGTWAVIYALPGAGGGTFSGTINSTISGGSAVVLNSNNAWQLYTAGGIGSNPNLIMEFPATGGGWLECFMFSSDGSSGTLTVPFGSMNIQAGGNYKWGGLNVVGARQTGWTAATGTATRTTFVTSSVSTSVLAEHVKALIDDLTAHGLIGT